MLNLVMLNLVINFSISAAAVKAITAYCIIAKFLFLYTFMRPRSLLQIIFIKYFVDRKLSTIVFSVEGLFII